MTTPLISLLSELKDVICHLSNSHYSQKPVGVVESSIGAHVRHCLDHVRSLLDAAEDGRLNYDHRRRGTAVENSRIAAIESIQSLVAELESLPPTMEQQCIRISVMMCCDGVPFDVPTSLGREMAYVLAHTIHHNALIAAMIKTLGGWLPDHFGYAPSTVRHMKDHACVR
jgi:uncharacterized damage-inducible protein DinB